jgi:hypothetical protein
MAMPNKGFGSITLPITTIRRIDKMILPLSTERKKRSQIIEKALGLLEEKWNVK